MEAPNAVTDDGADKRREHRQRTLKGARVVFNGGFGVYDCTVRNISPNGAMLVLGSATGIPTHFELHLEEGHVRHRCTVRWRTERALGVSFDQDS